MKAANRSDGWPSGWRARRLWRFMLRRMGRTVETAQILAEPHRLEVQTRDGLREISHGRWEQMTRKEVEQAFPEEAAAWEKDPLHLRAGRRRERARRDGARFTSPDGNRPRARRRKCLIVSHKATIRLLLSSLIGFDPRRYRDTLDLNPAALNIVDFRGGLARGSHYLTTRRITRPPGGPSPRCRRRACRRLGTKTHEVSASSVAASLCEA